MGPIGAMGRRTGVRSATRLLCEVAVAVGALVLVAAAPAAAANPGRGGGPPGGSPGGPPGGGGVAGSTTYGFDVSYPQCGSALPTPAAFGIVGVNGGLADDLNPCFAPSSSYGSYTQSELYWAVTATVGGTSQPDASLYVNTADPGNLSNNTLITDWPTSGGNLQYGPCSTTTVKVRGHDDVVGANSNACAWQYGYDMAATDTAALSTGAQAIDAQESSVVVSKIPGSYHWWLDVETANTWQADATMNVADLQGMIAALEAAGVGVATIGAYSTSAQWDSITGGTTSASGSLFGIADWIPGATSLAQATSNCAQPSFTGGTVAMTQWTATVDSDWAC